MSKTAHEIVEEVNTLAATMLGFLDTGYVAPTGHKFYEATDPRSRAAWQHAVEAYEMVTKSEVLDALMEVIENPKETFFVDIQQYVEKVTRIEVVAGDLEEARAIALTRTDSATWRDGEDAQTAEVYSVSNVRDEVIWER